MIEMVGCVMQIETSSGRNRKSPVGVASGLTLHEVELDGFVLRTETDNETWFAVVSKAKLPETVFKDSSQNSFQCVRHSNVFLTQLAPSMLRPMPIIVLQIKNACLRAIKSGNGTLQRGKTIILWGAFICKNNHCD